MTSCFLRVQQWFGARLASLRADERGLMTTETAIITGLIAVLAAGLVAVITNSVNFHQSLIPGGGG
jgi:Flp pilus assembly pilin Flp